MKKFMVLILTLLMVSCSSRADYPESRVGPQVSVEYRDGVFIVTPGEGRITRAFIFYPGGLVEPDAYLPLASLIAREARMRVYIPRRPFNLAVLGPDKAADLIEAGEAGFTWYLGGHSLGGAMASAFVHDNPDLAAGLILLAAYPLEKKPLTKYGIAVLSITASEDRRGPRALTGPAPSEYS